MRRWFAAPLLALALLLCGLAASAQDLLAVPAIEGRRVIDTTGTLTAEQTVALTTRLAAIEAQRGTQIVVLMVPSVTPEDIADFTQRVGDAWKLGRAKVGDGLLIVVAKADRKVRIAPAKALEGAIPDVVARRIITEQIAPAFKAEDYAGGLSKAIDRIDQRLSGEALPEPEPRGSGGQRASDGFDWQDLAIFLFVGAPIAGAFLKGIFGRKLGTVLTGGVIGGLGWWLTASLLVAGGAALIALFLVGVMGGGGGRRGGIGGLGAGPVIWGGGGSGGFGGGGGFGSGGGGDFGGGGASGDW
jgi:uncharacterized protein